MDLPETFPFEVQSFETMKYFLFFFEPHRHYLRRSKKLHDRPAPHIEPYFLEYLNEITAEFPDVTDPGFLCKPERFILSSCRNQQDHPAGGDQHAIKFLQRLNIIFHMLQDMAAVDNLERVIGILDIHDIHFYHGPCHIQVGRQITRLEKA